MNLMRKFLGLSPAHRGCLVEAGVWLGLARLAILVLPFRWIALGLGKHMTQSAVESGLTPPEVLDRISWAVSNASHYLPWKSTCLVQAIAAKAMLKRRGVPSTLYLGVAKNGETQLQAHAWLRCEDRILAGQQGMENYFVISTFAEDGK
jgi:hypothetical protein